MHGIVYIKYIASYIVTSYWLEQTKSTSYLQLVIIGQTVILCDKSFDDLWIMWCAGL